MNFIPQLEREGGHIAILTSLLIICIALSLYVPENQFIGKVGDMTLGALLLAMKGNGNGKTAPATPPAPTPTAADNSAPAGTPIVANGNGCKIEVPQTTGDGQV